MTTDTVSDPPDHSKRGLRATVTELNSRRDVGVATSAPGDITPGTPLEELALFKARVTVDAGRTLDGAELAVPARIVELLVATIVDDTLHFAETWAES